MNSVLENETVEQAAPVKPPEFPRYFKARPPLKMWSVANTCHVVCLRHDDPGCAVYYESGRWVPCDCGECTLDATLRIVADGDFMEITATDALLLIGASQ